MSVVRATGKEVVVDASLALKWALPEPYEKEAIALLKRWRKQNVLIIAPLIFHAEVDSAIRRKVFDGELTVSQARKAYALVDAFPVALTNVKGVRKRARQIAEQFHQRFVYDSIYAALAELRGCEFWTADKAFFDAVKRRLPFVRWIGQYRIMAR
jgi:predicted nucleic acid-binding protein